jgi:hypothetical protein
VILKMDGSKLKIIKIGVEYHNQEDGYYTDYNNMYFFTFERSDEEIYSILDNLNIKQYDRDTAIYNKEIDTKDLENKLKEHKIFRITPDIKYIYDINEDEKYITGTRE